MQHVDLRELCDASLADNFVRMNFDKVLDFLTLNDERTLVSLTTEYTLSSCEKKKN